MIGIYRIRNIYNGKVYVGSSARCIIKRIWSHCRELRNNTHSNEHLQRAWNLYGEESFEIEVVEVLKPKSYWSSFYLSVILERREQFYIDALPSIFIYNMCPVAGSRFGATMPESARKKIGDHFRNRTISEDQKALLSAINKGQGLGRKLSDEVKMKMSASRKGRKATPEHRAAMSVGRKGIVFSDEHRKNLSLAQKRRFARDRISFYNEDS